MANVNTFVGYDCKTLLWCIRMNCLEGTNNKIFFCPQNGFICEFTTVKPRLFKLQSSGCKLIYSTPLKV